MERKQISAIEAAMGQINSSGDKYSPSCIILLKKDLKRYMKNAKKEKSMAPPTAVPVSPAKRLADKKSATKPKPKE